MSAPRPRLVVRNHAPGRRALWALGAMLVVLAAVAAAFEWGRSRAGFDAAAARDERADLKDQIAALEEQLRATRLKVAMYETDSAGQTREKTELSKTIGELQAEVARLTSDVAFYRGVVEERTTGNVLKIQQFHVVAGENPGEYVLRLVLGRPLRSEDSISGKARITVEGTGADGMPASYDLAQIGGVTGGELLFSMRYLETLEQTVKLPEGFAPSRSTVELTPSRKGANPVRETFVWTVEN
jgi:hypothetical protein